MANKWQRAYNWIKGWKAPRCLKALIKLAWLILKQYPHITAIAMRAFEVSKMVEGEDIAGLLKKEKVVTEINNVAELFGTKLPTYVANTINELCTLAVKLGVGSKESE